MMIGCSTSFEADRIKHLYDRGFRVFQVSLPSPQDGDYQAIEKNLLEVVSHCPDVRIVAHAPLWHNIVSGNGLADRTGEDMISQINLLERLGATDYICRLGWSDTPNMCIVENATKLLTLVIKNTSGVHILLENTPGDVRDLAGSFIQNKTVMGEVRSRRLALCLDIRHACSRKEHILVSLANDPPTSLLRNYVRLVHLGTREGEGLEKSRELSVATLEKTFLLCQKLDIPVILEGQDEAVLEEDMRTLKRWKCG